MDLKAKYPKLPLQEIAKKTHQEMVQKKAAGKLGMTGRGDKVPAADTILRHALQTRKSGTATMPLEQ
jgi:hypothetical protein